MRLFLEGPPAIWLVSWCTLWNQRLGWHGMIFRWWGEDGSKQKKRFFFFPKRLRFGGDRVIWYAGVIKCQLDILLCQVEFTLQIKQVKQEEMGNQRAIEAQFLFDVLRWFWAHKSIQNQWFLVSNMPMMHGMFLHSQVWIHGSQSKDFDSWCFNLQIYA